MSTPEKNITCLNLSLPPVPISAGSYVPVHRAGDLLFVSGQIARREGKVLHPGRVGESVSIEQAREAARQCALQVLAILRSEIGTLDRIGSIVRVEGFVAASPLFLDHPKVLDAASDIFSAVFGDRGRHARFVVGAPSLPLGACVEIAVIAKVAAD